ncbi:MAG: dihydrolipoyl dehydrogenase [Thermoguttaceae bacterium]|nr:dihydrolipoyl dehydrogenase [Thermoguttaceae bacterium]
MPFQVAILGAGPGGYICAIRCAQFGLKTLLVEERELGGTCLNRGCIPTKTILHSAHLYHDVCRCAKFGIQVENPAYDYGAVAARRDKIVGQLRGGIDSVLKSYGVTVAEGRGKLLSSHKIEVGGEVYEARNVVLATGTRPSVPKIEGADGANVLSTDDFLALEKLPDSAVIIGGGVTGIEFASILASFGKKVTVLKRSAEVLPGADEDVTRLLLRKLKQLRVVFKSGITFKRISGESEKTVEYVENGTGKEGKAVGAAVILCSGREPNTDGLGLENAGVETVRGYVPVDDRLRTNVASVYAIGDVNGRHALAHAASAQGKAVAAEIASRPYLYHDGAVPSCVYTSPEAAWVGLSQSQAEARGYAVRVGRYHIPAAGKGLVMGVDTGLVKVVSDEKTGKLLGAAIISPRATDMIAEIAALISVGATAADLAGTIHPHPTLSEVMWEAADDLLGLCCHTPKPETE